MVLVTPKANERRLEANAGIAIGPILFIIAILGILATAIAAGSGSFSGNTAKEGNNTKASTLIEIGQSLRIGFDRLRGSGLLVTDVIIDPADLTSPSSLYAPTGGGVSAPGTMLKATKAPTAAGTASDQWFYPLLQLNSIGVSGAYSRVAMLRVDPGVCDQINQRAWGAAVPATEGGTAGFDVDLGGADIGIADYITTDGSADAVGAGSNAYVDASTTGGVAGSDWPTDQAGKLVGCIQYTGDTAGPGGYYFYQVLGTSD